MSPMPGSEQDLGDGDTGRTRAGDDDAQIAEAAAGQLRGVAQRGQHDDGGAVLVVVEDRDVERVLQPALELEAARRARCLRG